MSGKMDPPGPPYTCVQIANMPSAAARAAREELIGYIERIRRLKVQDSMKLVGKSHVTDEQVSSTPQAPPSSYWKTTSNSSPETRMAPTYRGGYRGRGGRAAYHPYRRPDPYVQKESGNISVKLEPQDLASDAPKSDKAATITTDSAYIKSDPDQNAKPQTACATFTLTGFCGQRGCRNVHDPQKRTICRNWLFTGECPDGDACSLSHSPTCHNSPMCKYFQEGRCIRDKCRWAHVRIDPAALNCKAFGLIGYCEKGTDCSELHAYECWTFSNTGSCPYGDRCDRRHVHRASRMRKATRQSPDGPSSPERSIKQESIDADDEACLVGVISEPQHFSQQPDYVALEADD